MPYVVEYSIMPPNFTRPKFGTTHKSKNEANTELQREQNKYPRARFRIVETAQGEPTPEEATA